MRITRHDKCATCKRVIIVQKEFMRPVDMFNPDDSGITPQMREQIIAWRDSDVYCDNHAYMNADKLVAKA